MSIREWTSENQTLAIVLVLAGITGFAVLMFWFRSFIPSIVGNIWVQRVVVLTIIASGSYAIGTVSTSNRFADFDWLVLLRSDGIHWYLGYYGEPDDGRYPLFIPVKGLTKLGHEANPYLIEDFSRELVRMQSGLNRDPKDPVVIRLHPEVSVVTQTDFGTIVGQLSSGLSLDEHGRESNVVAELPDMADDEVIDDLKESLDEVRNENDNLKADKQALKRQRDNAREEAKMNRREHIEEFLTFKQMSEMGESHGMGGGMAPAGGIEEPWPDESQSVMGDEELDEIDSELEVEDEDT